jgi:GNAT superfamily N-acetyltransferase
VSNERLDRLAESARNRGLKLVRSRVRTPKKRRFGKVGLIDAAGKPLFGMDAKGPTASTDEVEDYLRNLGAKDWGESLGVEVKPRKDRRKAAKAKPPPPPPNPQVREAKPSDAAVLSELIHFLGHEIDEKTVRKNLHALARDRETPLVAVEGKSIVGLIGIHRTRTVHRPAPVGRITILVVAKEAQGRGIGKMLVAAAEQILRKGGCQIIEVTSNERRAEAHAFYRHLGYERTSIRFMKRL